MVISTKQFRNVAIGTVVATGFMVANKQYVDPIALEVLPKLGMFTAGVGLLSRIGFRGINVFREMKGDSNVYMCKFFPSSSFSEGINLVLWGIGMPIATGAVSYMLNVLNAPVGNIFNTTSAAINNSAFLEILHLGSDVLTLSGVALCLVGGASHIVKDFKENFRKN